MTKILNTLRVTGTGSNYQALGVTGGYLAANSAVIGVNGLPSSLLSIVGSSTASYFDISNGTSYLLQVYGTYSSFSNNVMIGNTTSHYGKSFQISTSNAKAMNLISSTESYLAPYLGGPTYAWTVVKHNDISFINTYYGRNDVIANIGLVSDGWNAYSASGLNQQLGAWGGGALVFSVGSSVSTTGNLQGGGNKTVVNERLRIGTGEYVPFVSIPLNGSTANQPSLLVSSSPFGSGFTDADVVFISSGTTSRATLGIGSNNTGFNTGSELSVTSNIGRNYSIYSSYNGTSIPTYVSNSTTISSPIGFNIVAISSRGYYNQSNANATDLKSVGYYSRGGYLNTSASIFQLSWNSHTGFESSGAAINGQVATFSTTFTSSIGTVSDFRASSWGFGPNDAPYATYSYSTITTRYGLLIDYATPTFSYNGGTVSNRYVNPWGIYQTNRSVSNYLNGRTLYGATADDGTSLVQIAGTLSSQNILLTTNIPTTTSSLYSVIVRNSSTGRLETLTASLSSTASVSGTGSTNYLSYFNSSSTIAQSSIYQGSTNKTIVIGYTTSLSTYDTDTNALRVKGDVYFDNISNKFNIGGVQLFDTNSNIALGNGANNGGTAGSNNVALGYSSLMSNQTGIYNVGVGFNTLQTLTAGSYNMAVGANALYNNKGSRNTSIGYQSGYTSTGDGNTFIGNLAGTGMTSGNYNTFIGASSSWTSSVPSNYVVITDGIGTKKLVIDNTNAVKLYGPLIDIVGSTGLSGQVLSATSGGFVWVTSSSLSFIQNGNSFGSVATLGTNDNYALQFETNNIQAMQIDTNQNVSMGGVPDSNKLKVYGTASVGQITGLSNLTSLTFDGLLFAGLNRYIQVSQGTPIMYVNPNSFNFTSTEGNYYSFASGTVTATFSTVKVGTDSAKTVYNEFEAQINNGSIFRIIKGYVTLFTYGANVSTAELYIEYTRDYSYSRSGSTPIVSITASNPNIGQIYVVSATAGAFTLGSTISSFGGVNITTNITNRTQCSFTNV
jgi:hypothetical protein